MCAMDAVEDAIDGPKFVPKYLFDRILPSFRFTFLEAEYPLSLARTQDWK